MNFALFLLILLVVTGAVWLLELAWLRNKHEYYRAISEEDLPRIRMMEQRCGEPAHGRFARVAA